MEKEKSEVPGFYPLTIEEKDLFMRHRYMAEGALSSIMHFSTLIAWKDWTEVCWKRVGNYLCILYRDKDEKRWYGLPPLGSYRSGYRGNLNNALYEMQEAQRLCGPPDSAFQINQVKAWMLPYFEEQRTFHFQTVYSRDDSDYLYRVNDFLAALEEPKTRYDIHHFIRYHNPVIQSFSEQNREECMRILHDVWCENHACTECVEGCQNDALKTFLDNRIALDMKGFLVYAGEEPVGYVGVASDRDEIIFQMKKNRHDIRGLGSFLHREAYYRYCRDYEWINYTEDMGRPGLRRYKEHLAPYMLSHNFKLISENKNVKAAGVIWNRTEKD